MTKRQSVLVLGATGLFGGLLVNRLMREQRFTVIGAGRGLAALQALKQQSGVEIVVVDRDDPLAVSRTLSAHNPFAVVDCAGPFQYYGEKPYRFARQVIEAGCHYIDIADANGFVTGIVELDALAKSCGVAAISGASSTPAISAAAADALSEGMERIKSVETTIVPGNRARRTLSVMKSILGQLGQPFEITRHGQTETVYGWGETKTVNLTLLAGSAVSNRLASLIHTPDIELFPLRYGASTVIFRAGLEMKFFHRTLQVLHWCVRKRLLPTLAPFAAAARWIASGFEQCGSDIGGMQVIVTGQTANEPVRRTWELVADDGRGPEIPTMPVSIILNKLLDAQVVPGARASPGEVTLDEVEASMAGIDAETVTVEALCIPVFKAVLGDAFDSLPTAVRALHNNLGQAYYAGSAQSEGPSGWSGWLAAWIVGFPVAGKRIPVRVTITADTDGESWERDFNGKVFHSHLSVDGHGNMQERFGPMTAGLGLYQAGQQLHFPVRSAKLFGVLPLPRFLLPISITHESVDAQGRFVFDVLLKTPFGGRIAHYKGWLEKSV